MAAERSGIRRSATGHCQGKVARVGRYFGREPRFSRQEIEEQAKAAIEARVGLGRPPAEDWAPLEARLAEMETQAAPAPVPSPEPTPEPTPAPARTGAS